ncbi:MAG: PepSY-associated TM helix domain-containing protein [Pseudohongiella sp.]|nr:PepSY-associated TM helix domain-containing protein [Pseudohongiella sp.]MDP2284336.1 PepSY-associated TM helix domain-containing protein [Pseudohongiella sp.]
MLSAARRFWVLCHLYLGLGIGGVFALLSLTGSMLVFYIEIDHWLTPELRIEMPADRQSASLQDMVNALHKAHPQRQYSWRLEIPQQASAALIARYYRAEETAHLDFAPLISAVNPYTLEVVSNRFWGQYPMTWLLDLHYTFLLGADGTTLVAIAGLLCMLSMLTGIVLWWPSADRWRKSLSWRWRRGFARQIYDLHVLPGIYGFLFLSVLIVTGVILARPDWFTPMLEKTGTLYQVPTVRSSLAAGQQRISADVALAAAQAVFPGANVRWLHTPDDDEGVYFLRFEQAAEPGRRFPVSRVWVNQYSGDVLASYDPLSAGFADTFMAWQHPLHNGEAFGLFGRLLVTLSGLLPALLLATGIVRWRQKRKVSREKTKTVSGF